jgi:hypothetical protein
MLAQELKYPMSNQIFILTHVLELSEDQEDVKLIGVYSTQEQAEAARGRAQQRPGFAEHADTFFIQAYELDRDHWEEGFDVDEAGDDEDEVG